MKEIEKNLFSIKNWEELEELMQSLDTFEGLTLVSFIRTEEYKYEEICFAKVKTDSSEPYREMQQKLVNLLWEK